MNTPQIVALRTSAQSVAAATETATAKLQRDCAEFTAVLDVSAIGLLTQAADTLDVYVDASHDGTVFFNVGRFLRITGVDSVAATGTLTSTGAITSGVQAQSVLTSTGTAPADAASATIGTTVYVFKTTLTGAAFEVLIGGSAANALANLKKAINLTGVAGTDYGVGTTAHPTVVGYTLTTTTLLVVARVTGTAANSTATTQAGTSHMTWEATTLGAGTGASVAGVVGETVTIGVQVYVFVSALSETAGAAPVPGEVLYGSTVTTAFAHLRSAVNASAGAGTNYATGTSANAGATSPASDATTVSLTAATIGTPGNSVATTETMANAAFGATTLTGGTFGPGVVARQALKWSPAILESSQPVNVESDISSTSGGIRQVGFGAWVRYRSIITGAEPDFTFSVVGVGKS